SWAFGLCTLCFVLGVSFGFKHKEQNTKIQDPRSKTKNPRPKTTPSFPARQVLPARRVVDAAQFFHATVVDRAFGDLVTEQGKHSPAQEQRSRVAIPVDARCTTVIVRSVFRSRAELADFAKLQRVVAQDKN